MANDTSPSVVPEKVSLPHSPARKQYRAGSLEYTRAGLVMLFFWLLWGSWFYSLMEALLPVMLPLLLKGHQASDATIAFITTSLNVMGNTVFVPLVSFWSDRHRGRWGRRRPYMLWSTPFVVFSLALVPFAPEIVDFLMESSVVQQVFSWSPIAPVILCIGFFVAIFQIFDTFVGTLSGCLFVDTMPEQFMGRFFGISRIVGGGVSLAFNLLLLPHLETHTKLVFSAVAGVYGIAICLMCLNIKEPDLPPPEPLPTHSRHWYLRMFGAIRLYLTDCFTHPIYWWCFVAGGFGLWGGAAGVFQILFWKQDLGIGLKTIGYVESIRTVLNMAVALPIGIMLDKLNFFRINQIGSLAKGVSALVAWFVVHDATTVLVTYTAITLSQQFFHMSWGRVNIAVFPRTKFAQFGAANALIGSLGMIGMSVLAGKFVTWMGTYRAYLLWVAAFSFVTAWGFLMLERQHKRLGGSDNYQAP